MLNSPYYTDTEVRKTIDEVLHTNVRIFQNLGVSSSKSDRQKARVEERKNLREVKELDPNFIGFLLSNSTE